MSGTEVHPKDLGRQRLMLSKLRSLEGDLVRIQQRLDSLERRLSEMENRLLSQGATIEDHDRRIHALRLDRQLRQFPRWLVRRFSTRR